MPKPLFATSVETQNAGAFAPATMNSVGAVTTFSPSAPSAPARKVVNIRDVGQVTNYGAESQNKVTKFADDILAQVKTSAAGEMAPKLVQIVSVAKELNISDLNGNTSKVPFIGKFIDVFKKNREKFVAKYNSLQDQIDTIVKEIDVTSTNLVKRNALLEEMYQHNMSEYKMLEELIEAGKAQLLDENQKYEQSLADSTASGATNDPLVAQDFADWKAAITRFEKQVSYLEATQMMAVHTMPEIRLIQKNNEMLVEKFANAKRHTIPAWKKQFILALALDEQQKAGQMATTIDDATNEFYRRNADLLKANTTMVAKANERNVIDLETLQYAQQSLISTFEELKTIEAEGAKKRQELTVAVGNMKQELYQKLVVQK